MINKQQLLDAIGIDEESFLLKIENNDLEDNLNYYESVINNLGLGFHVGELTWEGIVAYYELAYGDLVFIGRPEMSYESIDLFLKEINTFEEIMKEGKY